MAGYICITHATTHREEAERLCRVLKRYGFRYRCMDEGIGAVAREELLADASALLAVTGVSATDAGYASIEADIERCLPRRMPILCLGLQENELDTRYLGASDGSSPGRVALIPFTVGRMPDRHSVALFLHRLFIRHLATLSDCFSPDRCVDDGYSRMVGLAVRAHLDDGEACYALGRAYESGDRVPAIEHEAALWITRAAECGVIDACIHMGELHLLGRCRHPDPAEAYRLFGAAADAGDVRGYYHRGICAIYGLGCKSDPAQAVADISVAALAGYAPALYRLGLLYRDGAAEAENAYRAAMHCLYAACCRGAASTVSTASEPTDRPAVFVPAGSTRPWAPTVRTGPVTLVWTPVEPRGGAGGVSLRHKRLVSRILTADRLIEEALAAGVLTAERATTVGDYPLPSPPSLYSRRAGRKPRCITLRHLRRTHLWRLASGFKAYPGADITGYAPPALRDREAAAARCFRRACFRPTAGGYTGNRTDWVCALFGSRLDENTLIARSARWGGESVAASAEGHETYLDRASFDVADAALALGALLERGDPTTGIAPHPTRAAVWYRYAALGGNTEAYRRLGDLYRRGVGLPPDTTRAAALYAYAADHGDAEGQFARGVVCERGIGTPCDPDEAYRRYDEAARAGYAPAQNNLGGCYEFGIGVVPDMLAAVEWYTRASAARQPDALCRLGLCFESGRGVDADFPRAVRLYEAAARCGHPYALYRLGLCYERGLVEVRQNEIKTAMSNEDVLYIPDGIPVPPPDASVPEALRPTPHYTEAVYLWAEAARRGLSEAAYALALCYAHGRGVPVDVDAYLRCLTEAAERKHIQALYRLGLAYLEGRGTPPDAAYARRCFTLAAQLWEARMASARRVPDAKEVDALPIGAMIAETAAAGALYMRGYCTLYAIGETLDESLIPSTEIGAAETFEADPSEADKSATDKPEIDASKIDSSETDEKATAPERSDRLDAPIIQRPKLRDGASDYELLKHRRPVPEGPTGAPGEPTARIPDPACLTRAAEDFRRAAELGHVGALTALGDLYTYGLIKPSAPAEVAPAVVALDYYTEAVRVGMTRVLSGGSTGPSKSSSSVGEGWLRDDAFRDGSARAAMYRFTALRNHGDLPADDPLHALLTVADRTNTLAAACEAEGERAEAELSRVKVWRLLAAAAELGSADARVAMAACAFFGHGTPENRMASLRLLKQAETLNGGRIAAFLRIGDFHRAGWCDTPDAVAADEAYLCALRTPPVGSECGPYTIAHRREARRAADRGARTEALYRLATLRAVAFVNDPTRGNAFRYLAEAILDGHAVATDDLARMYTHASDPTFADTTEKKGSTDRKHRRWMTQYYTALSPIPAPFRDALISEADPEALPAYITSPVTDAMRINALNYLGDCFFEGQGLAPDAASAIACYRRVAAMKDTVGRGMPVPRGLAWAQYSLGWCLLKGVGTRRDEREAVRFLSEAARSHGEAAFVLADCYERGIGVDVADVREAIKYYRRALKLGCTRAEARVTKLEEGLRRKD